MKGPESQLSARESVDGKCMLLKLKKKKKGCFSNQVMV